jgi:hypothetical protein
MKQKSDEMPDEWVRQMLNRLPDAPPPGSSFDSARLWNQLRPELQPKPNRQRAWWWLAAACLAGLLVGWQVWTLSNSELKTSPAAATYRSQTDTLAGAKSESIEQAIESGPAVAETHQPKRQRTINPDQRLPRPNDVTITHEPLELAPIAQAAEPAATSIVAGVPAPRKTNVVAMTPKRRFRVMHENELRAEDEAAPKIYPTNHFVRLGSGSTNNEQRTNNTPDNSPPALVMPLTSHPNQ